jgi:2-C-methyl-D-erythritol 2,4-cyclodiphosphate synthase
VFRVGIGTDLHPLAEGRPLVLGGVVLPEAERGAVGHSDADALCHAITDAILGALCEGDIGTHFPDQDPQWKGADSLDLLSRVARLMQERGYCLSNVDATIHLERPKLRPHIDAMRGKLAETLGAEIGCVSVKAKTGEGLDAIGRGEAISCQAVVLLTPAQIQNPKSKIYDASP